MKIKNCSINIDKFKELAKKGGCVLVASACCVALLSGCGSREVSTNATVDYDMLDTTNDELCSKGIQQVVDVPGQDFKLVVDYKCLLLEGAKWTVTSDKNLQMEVCTDGLVGDKKVYIDNIHTDTTVCSYFPVMDGIIQDSMDDRIHNAQMIGFPISDSNFYSGINVITGQDDSFIKGSFYGFNGYSSGNVTEKRYKESDYLDAGVYANKISTVIDLIVVDADNISTISVPSTITVSVWPFIEKVKDDGSSIYVYYTFDEKSGNIEKKEISEDEYKMLTSHNSLSLKP